MINISDLFPNWFTETSDLEFKERLDSKRQISWLKTIVGFMNCTGGVMVVGVSDPDGSLHGMNRQELDAQKRLFVDGVLRALVPSPGPGIMQYSYPSFRQDGSERYLMVITVAEGPYKPYAVKEDGGEVVYLRQEGETRKASVRDTIALAACSNSQAYDLFETDVPFLPSEFGKLYSRFEERNNAPLTERILESISFFDSKRNLRRGSLLFQDDCDFPETLVCCRRWKGLDRGSAVLIDRKDRKGDLIGQIDLLCSFVEKNSSIGLEKMDDGNREIRSYPVRAVLEAAVNAIVHRDYQIEGTQVDLDIFDDRLVITSPGTLLGFNGSCFHEEDLLALPSRRRNPLLADVLSLCRLMEKSGSGFLRIAESYQDAPAKKKPWWSARGASFTLTLPDLLFEGPGLPSLHKLLSFDPLPGKRKHDKAILSYCYEGSRKAVDIASAIGVSRSAYFYNTILAPLVKKGYLVEVGDGYRTNRDLVKEI